MSSSCHQLTAVVFDWAGTTIDHGSRAPAIVFQEVFRQRGVVITAAQAREPMGLAKRDHIAAIVAMPEVAQTWTHLFGHPCQDVDIDAMYADFLPLQKQTLQHHSTLIRGVPMAVDRCRGLGLRIGSSTGYTRELMEVVTPVAHAQGYAPDCVLCAEDAPRGRPAPYLLYEAAMRLEVFPMWSLVKVDDTPVGIEAGRNAGCWTIGITRTGNCVGLSEAEWDALPEAQQRDALAAAAEKLSAAGAHQIVESVVDVPEVLIEFDRRAALGELPITPLRGVIAGRT